MTKIFDKTFSRLTNSFSSLALLVFLTLSGNASAALLGGTISEPFITYFNPNQGATTYNSTTDSFTFNASPTDLQLVSGTLPVSFVGGNLRINITVDDTGTLTGGAPGNDLSVTGTVDVGGGPVSGILLTGEVTGFGFFNSSGTTDSFDFTFNLTGGLLANLYPTGAVGVKHTSESSSFNGVFTVDFSGKAKGTLGSVPAQPASLGDRVWEDLNANGVQDCTNTNGNGILGDVDVNDPTTPTVSDQGAECGDRTNGGAGIPGVTVELFKPDAMGDCTVATGLSQQTGDDGLYLFDNLVPGEYCVKFGPVPADFCDTTIDNVKYPLGTAKFTKLNIGTDEEVDSDADPVNGTTEPVNLGSGQVIRSIDAGFVCPAKIGNFVWEDLNKDGLQTGELGEGVKGVVVDLYECGPDGVAGTPDDVETGEFRVTEADGSYMFGAEPGAYDLPPGSYFVQFDPLTLPLNYVFTTPKVGGDDTIDSDCLAPTGTAACTTVGSRGINLNQDCGIVPAPPSECDLNLDLLCRVEPQPSTMVGEKCSGKLKQFTIIWDGSGPINIDSVNMGTTSTSGPINPGDAVTFYGPYSSNDVIVDISGSDSGQSKFHVSCSDSDFNSEDDCGKMAGNGKDDNGGFLNLWKLSGFIDANGDVLDCNPGMGNADDFMQSCSFVAPPPASCDTLGKPQSLTFEYTGGACPGDNDQGSKTSCSGSIDPAEAVVVSVDAGEGYMASPTLVGPGDTFTVSRGGSDLKSRTIIDLSNGGGTQNNDVHTSCSAPLAVGDEFGALTLVGINGQTGGVDVTYKYVVTNNGTVQTDIDVIDDPLGLIGNIPVLPMNGMEMFTKMTSITGTTMNTATATSAENCVATAMVTVEELGPPPCEVISDSTIKLKKKALEWKIQNVGGGDAVIESIEITWPNSTNGGLEKIKLGKKEIFKGNEPGSQAVITSFNGSVKDRTLTASKSKKSKKARKSQKGKKVKSETLKFEFSDDVSKNVGDYGIRIVFAEGCEVEFDPKDIPAGPFVCKDAKPIDSLSMIWNGPDGVTVESPNGDKVEGVLRNQEVTFSGLSGMGNDVFWDISGAVSGSSKFHVSCSDQDMNGPEDCGAAAGDGKDNSSGNINLWLFEGMQGSNGVGLDCSTLP